MKLPNHLRSFVVFLLLNCVVINAYSISISARRLYLAPNSSSTHIRVLNMDAKAQNCKVEIKDVAINSQGKITLVTSDKAAENSAKPLIRLAPKRFSLREREHQMVKLLYRRKPGVVNGEYQGVLAIKCKEKTESRDDNVTIEAALVHNVPVIVRTTKLPVVAEFTSAEVTGDNLLVGLKIQGKRSLTGDITVLDTASGVVVSERKHLSIYAQHPEVELTLPLGEYRNSPLLLKFTEDSNFGGNLMIELPVK